MFSKKALIINAIIYQACWFLCVKFSNTFAFPATLLMLAVHFYLVSNLFKKAFSIRSAYVLEGVWFLITAFIGFCIELLFFNMSVLNYENLNASFENLIIPPFWLICIWVLFASLTRISLTFAFKRWYLAAGLAGLGAPLSYIAGARFNQDVSIAEPFWLSVSLIGLVWAFLFPLYGVFFNYYFGRLQNPRYHLSS